MQPPSVTVPFSSKIRANFEITPFEASICIIPPPPFVPRKGSVPVPESEPFASSVL